MKAGACTDVDRTDGVRQEGQFVGRKLKDAEGGEIGHGQGQRDEGGLGDAQILQPREVRKQEGWHGEESGLVRQHQALEVGEGQTHICISDIKSPRAPMVSINASTGVAKDNQENSA